LLAADIGFSFYKLSAIYESDNLMSASIFTKKLKKTLKIPEKSLIY